MRLNKICLFAGSTLVLGFLGSAQAQETAGECAMKVATQRFAVVDTRTDLQGIINEALAMSDQVAAKCCELVVTPPESESESELHAGIVAAAESRFDMPAKIAAIPLEKLAEILIPAEVTNLNLLGRGHSARDQVVLQNKVRPGKVLTVESEGKSAKSHVHLTTQLSQDLKTASVFFGLVYVGSGGTSEWKGEEYLHAVTLANLF